MSIRLLIGLAAAVAVPVAVTGQPTASSPRKQATERRYCVVDNDPANRLRRISRCYTRAEREAMKAENRRTIDRIQTMRASN